MPVTRKSTRHPVPPQRYGTQPDDDSSSGSDAGEPTLDDVPSRADPAKAPQRLFLSTLYSEIDLAIPTVLAPGQLLTTIQDLIRLARTQAFFDSVTGLTERNRSNLRRRVGAQNSKSLSAPAKLALAALKNDVRKVDSFQTLRLGEAVSRLGYPSLVSCLLAQSFRTALDTEDCELPWDSMLEGLAKNVSSLELLAKSRGFKVGDVVIASNSHFEEVLAASGTALKSIVPKGLQGAQFGVTEETVVERHQIDAQVLDPNLWVLPVDADSAATRPTITYPNSEQLWLEFPQRRDQVSFEDQHQEYIQRSIVLEHYLWPNKSQWPENDPRYAGYDGDSCLQCGTIRALIPRTRRNPTTDARFRRCDCKLTELYNFQPPLIELFDTGRMGTGVRSLQNVGTSIILGEYVGEIYPSHKAQNQDEVPARYGEGDGGMYRMGLHMVKRHATATRKRKAGEATTATSAPAAKKAKTARKRPRYDTSDPDENKNTAAAALDANEYVAYVCDSALAGNWTRYINHSCDPNTEFVTVNIGMRTTPLIKTTRNIEFGEDITVNYGPDFLANLKIACRCGLSTCLKWNPVEEGRDGAEMLGDAVEKGRGPEWIAGRTIGNLTKEARDALVRMEKVIEVTDKKVLDSAKRKRDAVMKQRGEATSKKTAAASTTGSWARKTATKKPSATTAIAKKTAAKRARS